MIKEFTLGASVWKVEEVEELRNSEVMGLSSLGETKIFISNTWQGDKMSKASKEATLYHEVVHAILDSLGQHKLSKDEILVQGIALLMEQFEKSKT